MSETAIKLMLLAWKNLTRIFYQSFSIFLAFCNNSVTTVSQSCFVWLKVICLYFPKDNRYIQQKLQKGLCLFNVII